MASRGRKTMEVRGEKKRKKQNDEGVEKTRRKRKEYR